MTLWPRQKRNKVAKLEVEGPGFNPDTTLTATTLTVGKDSYPTSEITGIRAFTKPSALVAAVYQVSVGSQVVNISFAQRDERAGRAIVEAIERMAARNLASTVSDGPAGDVVAGQEAGRDPLQMARGMYDWCVAHGLADVMDEENGLRHFRVIEHALRPDERVLGAFAALQNYESSARSDGVFAFVATDQRLLASQQRVFGLEPWSVAWEDVGGVELMQGRGRSVVTLVGEAGATSMGVDPEVGPAVLELLRSAWRGDGGPDAGASGVGEGSQPIVGAGEMPRRADETREVAAARAAREAMDPYEEVKKAKELLDLGILTQEEFDRKKRDLLGL